MRPQPPPPPPPLPLPADVLATTAVLLTVTVISWVPVRAGIALSTTVIRSTCGPSDNSVVFQAVCPPFR